MNKTLNRQERQERQGKPEIIEVGYSNIFAFLASLAVNFFFSGS
jgi:hypothetical protein